jgi:hypothetical protein
LALGGKSHSPPLVITASRGPQIHLAATSLDTIRQLFEIKAIFNGSLGLCRQRHMRNAGKTVVSNNTVSGEPTAYVFACYR